jgi:hypothetical protein
MLTYVALKAHMDLIVQIVQEGEIIPVMATELVRGKERKKKLMEGVHVDLVIRGFIASHVKMATTCWMMAALVKNVINRVKMCVLVLVEGIVRNAPMDIGGKKRAEIVKILMSVLMELLNVKMGHIATIQLVTMNA